ncbi:A disintegrin and metalloproteinase with thrombospondin motifs 16 [Varanus komodoensis]|nr:A disintegrin and metalloproteinase with thrombospondin motifs 16 [Varanus komodoensis]
MRCPLQWCRGGQCVKYGDEGPKPTHGHWSEWSRWSSCSRTCGGGISHRERYCTNPRPSHGGKFCEGSARMLRLCNSQTCPKDSLAFRAAQCAEFNTRRFRGWNYKWKPYTQVEDQDLCKLYCIAEGFDFFFSLSNKVKDGTPCSEESPNVCIDGICEVVGCDLVLGSSAVEDTCGVCKGDNSSCRIYKGQFTKSHPTNQYHALVTIPAGARSIRVSEMNVSSSYIAVRGSSKKYHLNGYWTVDWPGRYKFAGSVFDYRRPHNQPETLSASGPINESVVIELLSQGKNLGISWEYSLPKAESERTAAPKHNYTWTVTHSKCSVSCGIGNISLKSQTR